MSNKDNKDNKVADAVGTIVSIVERVLFVVIGLLLMSLIAGTAAHAAGLGYRWMPNMDTTKLAYLCGAWALYLWKR